ncbi:hypothetical protein SDC9_97129 [bioreactor metagenome]|uniref:Uncharacterized protein n=1 Tax=bioreactor metagenome TaxID=1076179 RepID=A0A645AB22_9ZZZZ
MRDGSLFYCDNFGILPAYVNNYAIFREKIIGAFPMAGNFSYYLICVIYRNTPVACSYYFGTFGMYINS